MLVGFYPAGCFFLKVNEMAFMGVPIKNLRAGDNKVRDLYVRFDINALAMVERELGKGVGQIFEDPENIGLDTLRVLLWAGTKWCYRRMTVELAGDILQAQQEDFKDLEPVTLALLEAMNKSGLMTEEDAEGEDENPKVSTDSEQEAAED